MRRADSDAGSAAKAHGRGGFAGRAAALSAAQVGLTSVKDSDLAVAVADGGSLNWRAMRSPSAGRDCVQYALLCRGMIDAAVDPLMKPWDIGALAPCVLRRRFDQRSHRRDDANRGTQLVRRCQLRAITPGDLRPCRQAARGCAAGG